jgi:hypothetical protein
VAGKQTSYGCVANVRRITLDTVPEEQYQRGQSSQYDLVSCERPPVAEVALSMQFAPETFDVEAFGRFARETRAELPDRQRQPMLPPITETFDKASAPPSMEIRLELPTALPRTWFLSKDGVQLVQLQHDRLTLNWRELDRGLEYPRYEQLRQRFCELLKLLTDGLEEAGDPYAVNLCEVTYVNPIELAASCLPPADTANHPDLAEIINRLRPRPADAFLPDAEDAQLVARWRIPGSELGAVDAPAGRLYLNAAPGLKPPSFTPIYLVNMTAHVIPLAGDAEGALRALDVGHKWVVLGFTDLTTTKMHRLWGLKERNA